jgi:hypothetical protein
MRGTRWMTLVSVMLWACSASVAHGAVNGWTPIGPYGGTVFALALDPATPTTLYAGTDGGGVFKSPDGGDTWHAVSTGLTGRYVTALAVDPATPTTLYAGTNRVGVFKSTDGGGN